MSAVSCRRMVLSMVKKSSWSGCHKEVLVWGGFGQGKGQASKILSVFRETLSLWLGTERISVPVLVSCRDNLQGRVTVFVNERKKDFWPIKKKL